MKSKKDRIIEEYEKVKTVHPSYAEIAEKVGTYKSYAFKVIKEYLGSKNSSLQGK
jgi:hypothetical protein